MSFASLLTLSTLDCSIFCLNLLCRHSITLYFVLSHSWPLKDVIDTLGALTELPLLAFFALPNCTLDIYYTLHDICSI